MKRRSKAQLREMAQVYYNTTIPEYTTRQDLLTLLYRESELQGAGFSGFMSKLSNEVSKLISKGKGMVKRSVKLSPRKVLPDRAPHEITKTEAPQAKPNRISTLWNQLNGQGVLTRKEYPINYGVDAEAVISAMSFDATQVQVLGSMAIKSTLYPSDFDLYEVVKVSSITSLVKRFQKMVKHLRRMEGVHVGDIKAGEVKAFKVINDKAYFKAGKVVGSNPKETRERLRRLAKDGVISPADLKEAMALVKENPTEKEWNTMKNHLRFHVMRWTPEEVKAGRKQVGIHEITLHDALRSEGLFKMDVVAITDAKYMDYSIIYDLRDKKTGTRINSFQVNVKDNLAEAIETYTEEGEYWKALKRRYSLLKYKYMYDKKTNQDEALKEMKDLVGFFNGDAGLLASVRNDCETLLGLYELDDDTADDETILRTLNSFVYRLSNVYDVSAFMKKETTILKTIKGAVKSPDTIPTVLRSLLPTLSQMLNKEAKKHAIKNKIFTSYK